MTQTEQRHVVAALTPSPMRRGAAVVVLVTLGGLSINLGVAAGDASALARLALCAFGVAAIWVSVKCWRATAHGIVLHSDGTIGEGGVGGQALVHVSQIQSIARGPFASKPSQGFTLVLNDKQPLAWAPGLWWRVGKRLGLGGVTRAHEGKVMAEAIEMMRAGLGPK